jgi:hypothetical protein
MSSLGSFGGRAAMVAVAIAAVAAPAGAQQERTLFSWNGRVDREVLIYMRGRDVSTRFVNGERGTDRVRAEGVLPRAEGVVTVNVRDGRGDVDVVQQPNARNDYTTIVRIRDQRSSDDRYRVVATWRGTSYGDGRWDDRDDRGRGNGRDRGGYGRGRDDDRYDDRDGRGRGNDGRGNDGRGTNGGWGNNAGWGNNGGSTGALQWRGQVDDVVEIRVQGRRVDYVTRSGATVRDVQTRVSGNGLPDRDVNVTIRNAQGRGNVWVAQQPTGRNGYTAVIRVQDPQGGFGHYDFQASW